VNQLQEDEDIQDPHKVKIQEKGKGQVVHIATQRKEYHQGDKVGKNGDTVMQLDEQYLMNIDLEKLEEALNHKYLQTIRIEKLRKVHKVFLDSIVRSTTRLGITIDPSIDSKHAPCENKRGGCKYSQQLIKEVGNFMLNLGHVHRLSEGYLHPPP